MSLFIPWAISGSYYEVCSCEAICPCRQHGTRKGERSSYGICDFALSWRVLGGHAGAVDLKDLSVVLAGSYCDDEPGAPWRVILYVDERGKAEQQQALTNIFLGRAGGTTLRNFARAIGEVYAVRPAEIALDHAPNQEHLSVEHYVTAKTARPVLSDEIVTCGIPGHDRPGQEIIADAFQVDDGALRWNIRGRCGFATSFAYSSHES
jgi:hypothetical protein